MINTLKESVNAITNGENIVIFPEDSTNGYLAELEGFHPGFVLLCERLKRQGIDVPIYVTYFRKSARTYIVDAPVMYSSISQGKTKEEIAKIMLDRCNELGKMEFVKEEKIEDLELTEVVDEK
jgi:1-acyl-sn-glycerol-3-phosphate acyltransferase